MKLAITGGAGFLGYHLCQKLHLSYDQILVLDTAPITPEEYPSNIVYCRTDVRNTEQVERALKGVDALIHAAAALPLCGRKEIFAVNVVGTRNILAAAKKHGIERIVYISSTAVYGVPEKHPIEEEDPVMGVGAYGESKIIAEILCSEYRQKGLSISTVRPKTFVGTGRLGVFQILYDWIQGGKRIPIIGKGENLYQLLEVEDLANAIALLLTAPSKKACGIFNVGAERFGTVLEDLGALCAYAETNARVLPTPARAVKFVLAMLEKMRLSPLYPWVYQTADKDSYVSIQKIQQAIGWTPRHSNTEALIKAYQWYLDYYCKDEQPQTTGVTHRMAWNQGILALFKQLL